MSTESVPDWLRPPPSGFTADDLDRLPGLPPHTELIDGSLILVSPQREFHQEVLFLLEAALRSCVPSGYRVRREMSVILGARQRPEPDLIVLDAQAVGDGRQTWYPAESVLLAVEVESPESELRDRLRKPELYAAAGIPYFWRIEEDSGDAVVHTYALPTGTGGYVATGAHRDRLNLTVPFAIDIDLTV